MSAEVGLATRSVLGDIAAERRRQDEKWGVQTHPNGTGGARFERLAGHYREECKERHADGVGTWADILAEEYFEALAESDPVKLRGELVQVAAVAAGWIENLDRDA
jgi:hypothetical protein